MVNFVILFALLQLLWGLTGQPYVKAMNNNLAAITWAHAVNNQSYLESVLKSDIHYIEGDIVMGTLINEPNREQPIMARLPARTSDLSLGGFLMLINDHNNEQEASSKKGVKLEFKEIEAFENSLPLLRSLWESMNYPVWMNADVLPGPLNDSGMDALDATRFLTGCKTLTESVVSIGWTTLWGSNYTEGTYNDTHIDSMIDVLNDNAIIGSSHPITFAVRAGIAAQSEQNIHRLVSAVNGTNNVTLTVWSSAIDAVNVDSLRKLIFSFGLDRVYVNVPEELKMQLDLVSAPGRSSMLIHFEIVTVVMMMMLTIFMISNGQYL